MFIEMDGSLTQASGNTATRGLRYLFRTLPAARCPLPAARKSTGGAGCRAAGSGLFNLSFRCNVYDLQLPWRRRWRQFGRRLIGRVALRSGFGICVKFAQDLHLWVLVVRSDDRVLSGGLAPMDAVRLSDGRGCVSPVGR